jgi:hypothetical protein
MLAARSSCPGDGEMHRDRRGRGADQHRHAMVLQQKVDLLAQVVANRSGRVTVLA